VDVDDVADVLEVYAAYMLFQRYILPPSPGSALEMESACTSERLAHIHMEEQLKNRINISN
jgi:hypothetical protein